MNKPEPKPTAVVCSMCGLPWDKHTEVKELAGEKLKEPTAELCIELLKAELAKPRTRIYGNTISGTTGYVAFQ